MRWWMRPTTMAPSLARNALGEWLSAWDVGEGTSDDLMLVVTELITNAVEHSVQDVSVTVTIHPHSIAVAVQDQASELPVPQPHNPRAERGRGLELVAALTTDWGWTAHDVGGKTVWANMPR